MDRITSRDLAGHAIVPIPRPKGNYAGPWTNPYESAVERLADYEDTGLTPQELKTVKAERDAMAAELKAIGGCDSCKHCNTDFDKDPCETCMKDPSFPAWEWKGRNKNHG